jgi:hypothetical protein
MSRCLGDAPKKNGKVCISKVRQKGTRQGSILPLRPIITSNICKTLYYLQAEFKQTILIRVDLVVSAQPEPQAGSLHGAVTSEEHREQ